MIDVEFHPEAQAEYEAAIGWYRLRSPRAALRFEEEVERVCAVIATNPELFARYDDEHRFALLHRFPYSLIYSVQPTAINIIAVAHSSRAPDYWRGRS